MGNREERVLIGIDGGGTKTEFILFTETGHILERILLTGSNPNDIGLERCCAILTEGIDELLKKAPSVCSIFAGIAGCTTGDNGEKVTDFLRRKYPQIQIKADTDGENILSCNPGGVDGMALICGTGSVLFVREHGVRHRIGGWGYLFDGAGSAYDIGCDAIRAALALNDGMRDTAVPAYNDEKKEETEYGAILAELVQEKLQGNIWESLNDIYRKGRPYIASLASLVFQAYEKQDYFAEQILRKNAAHLSKLIFTAMQNYQCGNSVVACGGLIEHYKEILLPMIRESLRVPVEFIFPDVPPVYGACVESCREISIMPDEKFYHTFAKEYKCLC